MAQMYPDAGPAEDCESSAERNLYYLFREVLSANYHVVHSAKWNVVAGNGRMQPGEADYIIVHPEKGILVLEVKGGRVRHDPRSGRWYVLDRNDRQDRIRDPFTQAMSSAKILERKLRSYAATQPFAANYRIAYGVWFPDMTWTRSGVGELRLIDEQVLDRADVDQPEAALDRLFRYAQGTAAAPALSNAALTPLLTLLAPDLTPAESPLSQLIEDESAVMERLTGEQFARLHVMWHTHRQLAIPGHAGTGKTVIALEMAWRLAQSGSQTLLLCANQTLAEYLRGRLEADRRPHSDGLRIRSLKELAVTVAQAGGFGAHDLAGLDYSSADGQVICSRTVARNLDTLAQLSRPFLFDAILVDEAQDLDAPLWPQLHRMLRPSDDPEVPAASHFYAFYDSEQRLTTPDWDPGWTGLPVLEPPLSMNCRNTRAIYDLMADLNEQLRDVPFIGPAGREVQYTSPEVSTPARSSARDHQQSAETRMLERVLDDLTGRQGIRPEQILVITCRSTVTGSANVTGWLRHDQHAIGRHYIRWLGAKRTTGFVSLASIRSAKGMEAPVVVLAELDGVERDAKRRRLLYAAVSRAKHHLVVLGQRDGLVTQSPPTTGAPVEQRGAAAVATQPSPAGDKILLTQTQQMQFSAYQKAIFQFVESGSGDGIVAAVAGSGKTTTLVEAAKLISVHDALFLAFNRHIADELKRRLADTRMVAKTIHSVGFGCLRRYLAKELDVREHKYGTLCRLWVAEHLDQLGSPEREEAEVALKRLVDLSRLTLSPLREPAALRRMASHYSIDCDPALLPQLIPAVPEVIAAGEQIARAEGMIDYTDMLYLPYRWRLRPWKQRWVFVDEAQDLNAAQLDLALKCRAPGGRMLFVGDPHQAIYGFTGADTESFANIKRRTQAKEFPLSICYRCPSSHVARARELVPAIEARPDAPVGIVADLSSANFHQHIRKGDLILCRKTAPLVEECIRLIQGGINAQVKGRDIGTDLTKIVQDVTHVPGYVWPLFGRCLEEYERLQCEKLAQVPGTEGQLQSLKDRVAAVKACYISLDAHDAGELSVRIGELFRDEHPDVLLSTVHRAKGLENDRIFILDPDSMPLQWPGQQAWELEQEYNIQYVAVTRAREELYFIV